MQLFKPNIQKLFEKKDTAGLVKALNNSDMSLRFLAAKALKELADPRSTPALIAALSDDYSPVREMAAEALGRIGDPSATQALIGALKEGCSNVSVSKAAAQALGCLAMQDLQPVIAVTRSKDWLVRQGACQALAQIGGPQAVQALVDGLHDPMVRYYAAEALEQAGLPPDPEIRARCAVAKGSWEDARSLGQAAVPPLIEALQDEESKLRQMAAYTLGEIGDPRATGPLIAALEDREYGVRGNAAWALGFMGETAVEALIEAADSFHLNTRAGAVAALENIGDPRAFEVFIAKLQDNYEQVRASAAGGLGQFHDPRAVEPLIQALKKDDWGMVHSAVAGSLGRIGDPRAIPALIEALNLADSNASRSVREALTAITGQDFDRDINSWQAWWKKQRGLQHA